MCVRLRQLLTGAQLPVAVSTVDRVKLPLHALPVFLLGAVLVLIIYQLRLGEHQAVYSGDDLESLQPFRTAVQQPSHQTVPVQQDTLVVYIYSEEDPVYKDNFQHFLIAAVQPNSRCRYIVVVQEKSLHSVEVPTLPEVTYVYYGGSCFEWGIVGWLFKDLEYVDWQQYQYYIFMSSAVRGPFMPTYVQSVMHWTEPLLSQLSDHIKLVGPTVVCTGAPKQPHAVNTTWRNNPHIPFSAIATDRVGLEVLMSDGGVMGCHSSIWAAKYHSELGAAAAMFKAGYSIGSLMIRYQGVDWSHESSWDCNRHYDPANIGDFPHDGLSADPMEVMFVRVNTALLAQQVPMALKAVKYSAWVADVAAAAAGLAHNLTARVSDNHYHVESGRYKLPRILTCMVRGMQCFDVEYFLAKNQDVFKHVARTKNNLQAVWKFFVYLGQFEDRKFKYTCGMNYSSVALPAF